MSKIEGSLARGGDVEVLTAARTLTADDNGLTVIAGAVNLKVTLPASAVGLRFGFAVKSVSATTGMQIDPVAADKIMDNGITSADDKDLVNTAVTDAEGDYCELIADGVDGWIVTSLRGTWAREA